MSRKRKPKYGAGEALGGPEQLELAGTELSPAHIQGFDQNEVVLRPCFQCARLCPWDATIGEGPHKGTLLHFNAGGEWLDSFFKLGIKGNSALYLAERNSIVDAFNAITGWNFTLDEALAAGHRSMILQSLFATQRGWIADFDWQDVGPRFLEPIPDGKYKRFTIAKGLPDMIWDYYKLFGRHERTGRPFKDTLEKLDLQEFMDWAQLD